MEMDPTNLEQINDCTWSGVQVVSDLRVRFLLHEIQAFLGRTLEDAVEDAVEDAGRPPAASLPWTQKTNKRASGAVSLAANAELMRSDDAPPASERWTASAGGGKEGFRHPPEVKDETALS